jgi:hypothetical protein
MSRGIGKQELGLILADYPRLTGPIKETFMSGFLSKAELEALVTGSIETADIADEALSADVAGRAKVADGFLQNAKVADDAAIAAPKLGTGTIKTALIDGGAAGDHTVTGIETDDELVCVLHLPDAGAVDDMADLTGEFSISAADTINNGGGTATTAGKLLVIYEDRSA